MKKKYLKFFTAIMLGSMNICAMAQMQDVTKVLNGGMDDANKLVKAYMQPYGEGFALGLANGWYNTAKPHKLFGFDLTLTAGITSIPTDKLTYDATKLGLSTLKVGNVKTGPTIAGKEVDGPQMILRQSASINGSSHTIETKFNMPQGINFAYTPSAMIQAGIGLPFGSEIMFRFLPSLKIGDFGKIGMWGIGAKHDIKQWIPVISSTPFWSMSVMAGYTSFKSSVSGNFLNPDQATYYMTNVNLNDYLNQSVELNSKAFTANLLVSSDIPIFNLYGGIGFTSASSELLLNGKYPTPTTPNTSDALNSLANGQNIKSGVKNVVNPINAQFDDLGTVFRANIGARLKLALITLHGDLTYSGGYTMYTAGFGFSFR